MTLRSFIRDNTDDGHNIARLLIDVLEGRLDGCKISHRLTAARLLTVYGHDDAPDFIADNTPDTPENERGEKVWGTIDPALVRLIRFKTDDGRAMCLFLIDVMQGRVEKIHVGHRVAAAKELLNRAFGKSRSRDLPKPPRSNTLKRSTNRTRRKHALTPEAAATEARAAARVTASKVAQSEPTHQPESEANGVFDPEVYKVVSKCEDPNFDPVLAATSNEYW